MTMIEEQTTEQETFRLDSDEKVNWLLRKLASIEAETQRIQAQASKMIAQLEHRKARLMERFQGELQDYCKRKLEQQGGKSRTLHFLQGSLSFRKVPGGLRLLNESEAADYARRHFPDLLVMTERLNTLAYREAAQTAYQSDGELLPGVDLTPDKESFLIRFPKPSDRLDESDE